MGWVGQTWIPGLFWTHMDREFWVGVGEPVPTPLHLGTGHKAGTDIEGYERLHRSLELPHGLNRACSHRRCGL